MTFDALDRLSYYVAPRLAEADGLCLARDFAVGAFELGADAMQWSRGYWAKTLITACAAGKRSVRRYRFVWAPNFVCPLRDANTSAIFPGLPVRLKKRDLEIFTRWRVGLYIARILIERRLSQHQEETKAAELAHNRGTIDVPSVPRVDENANEVQH